MPELPADSVQLQLPASFRRFLQAGWIAAFSLGLAEEEFYELAREVSENPSADGIGLELTERTDSSFVRRAFWSYTPTGVTFHKLTHERMKELHIREAVRPVLTQKELKRSRIAARLLGTGRALDLLRTRCAEAQLALSAGLSEAKTILLPNRLPEVSPSLPAAG